MMFLFTIVLKTTTKHKKNQNKKMSNFLDFSFYLFKLLIYIHIKISILRKEKIMIQKNQYENPVLVSL